ncbi:MAG TPA: hypothetical protein VFF73_23760 [Planctomycetota bacterium]|nr:hypothetical protein [Planctomycetota bacterium]
MAEIPYHADDMADLELGTDFDPKQKVSLHFDATPFETADDAGGGQHRAYDPVVSWDELILPTEKKDANKNVHSVVTWKAAPQAPSLGAATKPSEVRTVLYGKSKDGTAVSTQVSDVLLVVPGLIDARARVEQAATAAGLSVAPDPKTWLVDFNTPCILDGDAGWGRWNGALQQSVPLDGELRFVEARTTPKLFGLYIPKGTKTGTGPIDFCVFFHPAITGDAGFPPGEKNYPYAARYIQCIIGYLLSGAHQVQLSKRDVVYVFPLGSITQQLSTFTQGPVLLKLLKDLTVYLGRFAGFANSPHRDVGRVAAACYSFGANHMNALMGSSPPGSEFYDKHWFEAYHCDPVPVPDLQASYPAACVRWWNKGANKRCLRIYRQPSGWDPWPLMSAAMGSPKPTTVQGARQIDVPNDDGAGKGGATLVETHLEFWRGMFGATDPVKNGFFTIHGWFPNLFQYHGLKNSFFRTL